MVINVNYAKLKTFVSRKQVTPVVIICEDMIQIIASSLDDKVTFQCFLNSNLQDDDLADFNNNFKQQCDVYE